MLSLSSTLQVTVTKLLGSFPARVCAHTSMFPSLRGHTCQTHQVSCIYCLPARASTETPTCCICTARPGSGPVLCCADQPHPASLREASRLRSRGEHFGRTAAPPAQVFTTLPAAWVALLCAPGTALSDEKHFSPAHQSSQNVRGHASHTACRAFP